MKRWIMPSVTLLAVVLMLCFAGGTLYAPPGGHGHGGGGHGFGPGPGGPGNNQPQDLSYVEGVIKAVTPGGENQVGTITIGKKGESGADLKATLIVNADTQIFVGDDPKELTDLSVGDKATIAYVKPPKGTDPVAVLIRVPAKKGDKGNKGGEDKPPDAPKGD